MNRSRCALTWVGPNNNVLGGGLDPPRKKAIFGWGKGQPIVSTGNMKHQPWKDGGLDHLLAGEIIIWLVN